MAPLNDNSAAIFGMGANLVTSALPEEHKADMQMLGKGVGQILRNRFLQQQAEDFKNNELAAFQQASAQFGQEVSMIEDPNQQVQALMDYKNSVMVPFITTTSMKYANNEIIMNTAKSVFEMGPQLKDYISAGQLRNDTERLEVDRMNAETNKLEAQNRSKLLGLQIQEATPISANLPSGKLIEMLRNMKGPHVEEMDDSTLNSVAEADATSRTGQFDPIRKTQFGNFRQTRKDADGNVFQGDVDRSKAILSENAELKARILEFGRGVRMIGLDAMIQKFPGQYTDIIPYFTGQVEAPPEIQMKGAVPDKLIAGVFMNLPSAQMPGDFQSVDQYTQWIKTQSDPAVLGDRFYSAMSSAIRAEGKVLFVDRPGKGSQRLEFSETDYSGNRTKLKKIFQDQFDREITDVIVADDKSSITTRRKLGQIRDTAIDQFIQDWADLYGVKVKAPRAAAGRTKSEVDPDEGRLDRALRTIGIF